jgi:hypothetical protein
MFDASLSPLDAADVAFRSLVSAADPPTLDGAAIGYGLPGRLVRLDELKPMLLSSSLPFEARDAAIAELLRRARAGEERWMIGLVGVLMPGLRRVAGRLTRDYPSDPECIDAAVLAGLIEAAVHSEAPADGLAAHLLWAAFRAGREIWVQEVTANIHRAGGDRAELEAMSPRADHPDLVLARAVRARVISTDEAELIAVSRIEGVRLPELARRLGISHAAMRWRRCRAEARLVAYLERGDPELSRFRRNRGLGVCGTPRGGKARSGGQCDRRQPSTTSQPEKEVSKPRSGRPRPPRVPVPAQPRMRRT